MGGREYSEGQNLRRGSFWGVGGGRKSVLCERGGGEEGGLTAKNVCLRRVLG